MAGFMNFSNYDWSKKVVAPDDFLKHIKMMTLASDFIDTVNERGTIKLAVDTPEFRKANNGMIVFLNSAESSFNQNIGMVKSLQQRMNAARKSGKLSLDIPLGVVDSNNPENKFLMDYYKIKQFPTIVFPTLDGNFHQFSGIKGLTSAIKKHCESLGGECNVIDFGENTFLDPKDLNGAIVNVNIEGGARPQNPPALL
jgi:hypothetical protein